MSEKKIEQPALQKLFEKACMLDIRSLKPGNVNTNSPSKNLNYLDFLKSLPIEKQHRINSKCYLKLKLQELFTCWMETCWLIGKNMDNSGTIPAKKIPYILGNLA